MITVANKTYQAHTKQSRFHHEVGCNRVTLFNGGRGSGKTTAGAIQAIMEALQLQPGLAGLIVAPTYGILRKAGLAELLHWLPHQYIKRLVKSPDIEIELINGSQIFCGSAEHPDSLRGPNRAWLWMDEPRNTRTREAFDIASGQVRIGAERIWLTTTPAGIHHWLYDVFIANPLENSTYITVGTDDNPHTSDTYKQQLRSQYSGVFAAQELDAAFVSFEGLVYNNFLLSGNVSTDVQYNPALSVYWGVDDGYAHGDGCGSAGYHPRVIVVAQLQPNGALWIIDEYVHTLELAEVSIKNVIELDYALPEWAQVDSSAPEVRRRLAAIFGIPSVGATHQVSDGIKIVRRFLCDGQGVRMLKIHPRCKHTIREFQMYRYNDKGSAVDGGEPKPLKMDDHCMDAIRYLCYGFR